jgi:hypothetical protein
VTGDGPGCLENGVDLFGNRWFESTSLQRRVSGELRFGTVSIHGADQYAELRAAEFGFSKMILSTAEVQKAAIAFYTKSGFRLVRTEIVGTMSTKTVGGGLTRFHFEKVL